METRTGELATVVHVSWNGDTEAATWNVLHTNHIGNVSELVASSPRQGFETKLSIDGYMRNIVAVALDVKGEEIGRSNVVIVRIPPDLQSHSVAAEEAQWIENHSSAWQAASSEAQTQASASNWLMPGLIFCGVFGFVVPILLLRRKEVWWRSRQPAYESVASDDEETENYDKTLKKEETKGATKAVKSLTKEQ